MIEDLNAIDESALAPWQKIDAVSTFINPRIEFIARGGFVFKTLLYPIDKLTKKLAKRWLHLPQRASAEVVYLLPSQGGAGKQCDLRSHRESSPGVPWDSIHQPQRLQETISLNRSIRFNDFFQLRNRSIDWIVHLIFVPTATWLS